MDIEFDGASINTDDDRVEICFRDDNREYNISVWDPVVEIMAKGISPSKTSSIEREVNGVKYGFLGSDDKRGNDIRAAGIAALRYGECGFTVSGGVGDDFVPESSDDSDTNLDFIFKVNNFSFRPSALPKFKFTSSGDIRFCVNILKDRINFTNSKDEKVSVFFDNINRFSLHSRCVSSRKIAWLRYGAEVGFWLMRKADNMRSDLEDAGLSVDDKTIFCECGNELEEDEFRSRVNSGYSREKKFKYNDREFLVGLNYFEVRP